MAWLLGESDINNGFHNNYQANLTALIADVRATYGSNLPFVIIRLSDGQTSLDSGRLTIVQAAIDAVAAADPLTSVIDTDAFGIKGDNLHFDASGQKDIGNGAAEDFVYFKWMFDTFSSAEINAGLATMSGDGDGDGRSNRDEWIAGTDGSDPLSFFQASIVRTHPSGLDISYPDATGREFAVDEFDPGPQTWSEVLAPQAGDGGTATRNFSDSDADGLYRVRAQLP
jgi:hypothetical protein